MNPQHLHSLPYSRHLPERLLLGQTPQSKNPKSNPKTPKPERLPSRRVVQVSEDECTDRTPSPRQAHDQPQDPTLLFTQKPLPRRSPAHSDISIPGKHTSFANLTSPTAISGFSDRPSPQLKDMSPILEYFGKGRNWGKERKWWIQGRRGRGRSWTQRC